MSVFSLSREAVYQRKRGYELARSLLLGAKSRISEGVFEPDSKSIVEAVGSSVIDLSEFASIITKCKQLMVINLEFLVRFVRRKTNEIAHVIARNAHCCANLCSWVEAPSFVAALLNPVCTRLRSYFLIN